MHLERGVIHFIDDSIGGLLASMIEVLNHQGVEIVNDVAKLACRKRVSVDAVAASLFETYAQRCQQQTT